MRILSGKGLALVLALAGCGIVPSKEASVAASAQRPAMGWDARPEAEAWTHATLLAVEAEDARLAATLPGDIAAFCPAYADAPLPDRRAFWAGILSAIARYESTWNPAAVGGGGRYIGMLQISPRTAQHYACAASSPAALKDGAANLQCAVQIMASAVGSDGVVAGPQGRRGVGRDWGPLRQADKRAAIAAWTSRQDYCTR